MIISIGSDHRGFELKNKILDKFKDSSIKLIDLGCFEPIRCDYPIFARKVAQSILKKESDFGILICGSGVGMSIAANRFKKIYAALCWNSEVAEASYADDGANVLVLSSDFLSIQENMAIVVSMINSWKSNTFKGGRYKERLEMIDK